MFNQLRGKAAGIICLQETHSHPPNEKFWPSGLGGGSMYFSHGTTNARGVAIFINKNINFKLIKTHSDNEGRLVSVILELEGKKLGLACVYAPNISSNPSDKIAHESFLEHLRQHLNDIKNDYDLSNIIVAGDLNFIKDRQLDAFGGNPTLHPKSIALLNKISDEFALTDIFRELNGS